MHLLVIDNYDSFTYNLVQYFGELCASTEVIRNDSIAADNINVDSYNGIVISPGPCDPDRAGISLEVINKFAGKDFWTKIDLEYDYIYDQIKPMILEIEKKYIQLRDSKN